MVKLKGAVIGLGRMGAEPSARLQNILPQGWLPVSHAESIIENEDIELIALCDNDPERLAKLGKHYNVVNLYSDATKLIDEIKPDFLCIATRTLGRTDIIRYAAKKKVSILYVEKPLSRSVADCKSAMIICEENNVTIGYGVNRRYHGTYRKAKAIVNSGILGKLKSINIEHGRSALYWSHPHSVDLILFFAETTEVSSIQGSCVFSEDYISENPLFIDDDPIIENAFIKFENGITSSITQAGGLNVTLTCETGVITIYSDGESLEIRKGDVYYNNVEQIELGDLESATVTAFRELVSAHLTGSSAPICKEEIIANMTILNGIVYSSNNDGKRVIPSEIPEDLIITGKSGNFYA
jgi:scyllo-inositol 2-dehydrogenase (NAD+)